MGNYRGVPDAVRAIASRIRPVLSEQDLDTAARMYHQQNGDGWEKALEKDLKMRLMEQGGRTEPIQRSANPPDGYLGTTDGRSS